MVNITHKSNSLRKAIATATVAVSKKETIEAVKNKTVLIKVFSKVTLTFSEL